MQTSWLRDTVGKYIALSELSGFLTHVICLVPSKIRGTCASAPELDLRDLCGFWERTWGEVIHANDVIILYLDTCLIMVFFFNAGTPLGIRSFFLFLHTSAQPRIQTVLSRVTPTT